MKYVFYIFFLIPRLLWSQYHFDFEIEPGADSGFCHGSRVEQVPRGRWECLEEGSLSGRYSLHHSFDNSVRGVDYFILTLDPLREPDAFTFSFRLKHGYPPSSANNWQLAFLSEFSKGEIVDGLLMGVDYMDSDDLVKLWVCSKGKCREICQTTLNYQEQTGTDAAPEFKLVWSRQGMLVIYYSKDPAGEPLKQIGSCRLDTLPVGRHLVARYEYSPSQDRNLWIDDIYLWGHFVRDTVAPRVIGVDVPDGRYVEVSFSEQIEFPEEASFRLTGPSPGIMNPDSISEAPQGVMLKFPGTIPNREELELQVSGICDIDANCLSDTSITCLRNEAEWGDLVFNELMADPEPGVLLPEEEYVEFYNRSAFTLDLTGWKIEVNSRILMISGLAKTDDLRMDPGTYGLITGISLPNDRATLSLYSDKGTLIHAARYQVPWNGLDWKKEGGWSLESPDPDQVCTVSDLWEYSLSPVGGTPGRINSLDAELADKEPPVFLYPGYGRGKRPGVICLHYSEPVGFSQDDLSGFGIQPGNVMPDSVVSGNILGDQLNVWFPEKIQELSKLKVQIPGLTDCYQNLAGRMELDLGRISPVRFGSVLINEIMYHPEDGGAEFVELCVPGNNYYDLQDLSLGVTFDEELPGLLVPLSDHSRIISPGQYLVVSRNISHLTDFYNLEISGWWIGLQEMSELKNSGGTVYLTDRAGSVVDVAIYGDQMHMELVNVTQGVSLERISGDRPGTDPDNWHSAASIQGYSTPGRENSQSVTGNAPTDLLTIEPKVFSPDNDGFQDLLEISISTGMQDWVICMWITDLCGRRVKELANNHLTGPGVIYTWDGKREGGQTAAEGIYVVHVKGFHPEMGQGWVKKKAIGLIVR